MQGFDQSISYVGKNLSNTMNNLPDYNVGKDKYPLYSFPMRNRFDLERNIENPSPDAYNPNNKTNNNKFLDDLK